MKMIIRTSEPMSSPNNTMISECTWRSRSIEDDCNGMSISSRYTSYSSTSKIMREKGSYNHQYQSYSY